MTWADGIRAYNIDKEKKITKKIQFNDPKFFNTYVEKMSIQMEIKSVFYKIPYWENLNISHL